MNPRSSWAALLVVTGLVVSLLTIDPVAGLFAQTFRTVGVVASEPETPTPVVEARPRLAASTHTATPTTTATITATATATPSVTASPTPTSTSKAAPGLIATPSRATTLPGAASPPFVSPSLPPSTATAGACAPRPDALTLDPKEQRLSFDTPATATLTLSNPSGVAVPDSALLRLTFIGMTAGSMRITTLGSAWTPSPTDMTHDWRLAFQAASTPRQISVVFEQAPMLAATASRSVPAEARMHFDLVLPACGATPESTLASVEIVLVPTPPPPPPSPTQTATAIVPATPVLIATAVPIRTAVVATPILTKPAGTAPAAPVAVQKNAVDAASAR